MKPLGYHLGDTQPGHGGFRGQVGTPGWDMGWVLGTIMVGLGDHHGGMRPLG